MSFDAKHGTQVKLRSQLWFDNPDDPDMTALYMERYMNWGLTREELQSGKPLIGIAQSGSDLSPCNRHHIILAQRVREEIAELEAASESIRTKFKTYDQMPVEEQLALTLGFRENRSRLGEASRELLRLVCTAATTRP